jgi:mannose-6-phosphate isomerase
VFVPAGTVHAIGGGCLLAEIQQNSDLTYRIDDWGRVQADGSPRALHLEKAMQVIDFQAHSGATKPLTYDVPGARVRVLAACRYFAAERVDVSRECEFDTRGDSFQLCLGLEGRLTVAAGDSQRGLAPGSALMVTGNTERFVARGNGSFLRYYVPDLALDIAAPLGAARHSPASIVALGVDAQPSDPVPGAGAVPRDR